MLSLKNTFQEYKNRLTWYLKKDQVSHPSSVKISQKEKIQILDGLYNLINSWIPITNSLSILLFQTKNKSTKIVLQTLIKEINKGQKLQFGFSLFPKVFTHFDLSMIQMGEVTGKLANALEVIIQTEEKNRDLKSKVIGALIYPSIVISLATCMIFWFLIFIIPKIQKMYRDAKVNLPNLTQTVLDISDFIKEHSIIILLFLWGMVVLSIFFKNSSKTKIIWDQYILHFPLFGMLMRKKIFSIFSYTLGTLLQNGITIHEALKITKSSLGNVYYEKRLQEIEEEMSQGIPLSESLGIKKLKAKKEDEFFPLELASIVKIWEQTGKLPHLLVKISGKFSREVDSIVKWFSEAFEPIIIIGVWIIVGTLVMAILLPFFNMVNVV